MSTPIMARGGSRVLRLCDAPFALCTAMALLLTSPAFLSAQSATPLPAIETTTGSWRLMYEGIAFAQCDWQGGPRGASQGGSINWGMLMGTHAVGDGELQLRAMLSLDAVGVGGSGYPELLQSGESYEGQPLHDRQHPHDALMEIAAVYRRGLFQGVDFSLYAAPVGEPALGPVAFMERPSALDNPIAPIGHHWQDATHVSFGVVSAALTTARWKLEASWFNGREPDENRWNIDPIRLDSWAGRVIYSPESNWSFAASYGYLNSPTPLMPLVSERRYTLSLAHGVTLGKDGQWSSTLISGVNAPSGEPTSGSVLAESEVSLDARNSFVARAEYVQKSAIDLVLDVPPFGFAPYRQFDVSALSLGYVRELSTWSHATIGVGALGTFNLVPSALRAAYGSTTPAGIVVFVRVRPRRVGKGSMTDMPMDDAQGVTPRSVP